MKKVKEKLEDSKVLPIPMLGKELERFEGKTFYLAHFEYGVLFHSYNSSDVIIRPYMTSSFNFLVDMIHSANNIEELKDEEKANLETLMYATTYLLLMPTYAFTDLSFMLETATRNIDFIKKQYEELTNKALQEETPEENKLFEDAVMAVENIKKEVEESKEK